MKFSLARRLPPRLRAGARALHRVGLMLLALSGAKGQGPADPARLYTANKVAVSDRAAGIGKRVQPGRTLLFAQIAGPAIIRHFWMTNVRQVESVIAAGQVVIQFTWDDHGAPDLIVPLNEFFGDRFTDAKELSFPMELGKNAYYSMPFRRSAKIEIKNNSGTELFGIYWQIDYEKVPRIPDDLAYFDPRSRAPAPAPLDASGRATAHVENRGELAARGRLVLADLPGPAVIRKFQLSWDRKGGKEDALAGRGVIVRMFWDGEKEPSVESPLADFFGTGFGERRDFVSQAWAQRAGRCEIHFPMPFRRAAKIELVNLTDKSRPAFTWRIDYEQMKDGGLDADTEYFHACFRASRPVPLNSTHLAMEATGRGKFVGLVWSCHWINQDQAPEGTQNFWVDGVRIQATGSEDYFGRAWGFGKTPICFGYKGINLGPENSIGRGVPEWNRVTAYRAHVIDPIYFQKSLKLDLTCYGYNRGHRTDDYSTVCYWYQTEPHESYGELPPWEDLLPLDHPDSLGFGMWEVHALEARHDPEAAIARLDRLMREHPANAKVGDVLFKKGSLLEAQGRLDAAREIFRAVADGRGPAELRQDAADKLWLFEQPGRLLLRAAAVSDMVIFLDGKKLDIFSGPPGPVPAWGQRNIHRFTYPPMSVAWDKPSSAAMRLPTRRVEAGLGRHVLAVQARVLADEPIFTPKVGYFFADIDLVGPDIVTDATWRVSDVEAAGWEQPDHDDRAWTNATAHRLEIYPDGSWAWLWPRAFRNLPGQTGRIWGESIYPEDKAFKPVMFFRKQFDIAR